MGNKDIEQFLTDQRFRVESIINSLINYRVNLSPKYKRDIYDFFEQMENIENEELMVEGDKLKKIAKKYNEELESFSDIKKDSHRFFSKTLEGIAVIKREIQSLELSYLSQLRPNKGNQNIINREYTNMTCNGKMLILDDDVFILNILNRAFEVNGYDVRVTSNPYEAIDIVKAGLADIAIVDLIMPKLDGFQVLDRIKKENSDLPIVFITGSNKVETKVEALKRGVEDYITKPFNVEEVVARVESILKRTRDYKVNLNIDELTSAYTRKFFTSTVKQCKLDRIFDRKNMSVGFLDIDKFKLVNDTYGHLIGDKILKLFVKEAQAHLSKSKIFRFGGDEFLILFEDLSESEAKEQLESLRLHIEGLENRFEGLDEAVNITLSLGVTQFKQSDSVTTVLDRADKALYTAKESGRNRVVSYSDIGKGEGQNKKVLIIDSENIASNVVKPRLKSLGYDIKLADDILDINAGLKSELDLIMLDYKTFNKYKSQIDRDVICKNRILMMISEDEKDSFLEDNCLSTDDVIIKPLSVVELESKVRRILS